MKTLITISLSALILIAALNFSGCVKEENNEYPDVTAVNDTVYGTLKYKQPESTGGKIVAWPYGTATFKVIAGSSEVISTAPVNADGTFMVILPATVSGSYMSSLADVALSQNGSVVATPNTVRFLSTLQYKVDYSFEGTDKTIITNLYKLKSDNTVEKSYFFNFYDMDGTLKGTGAYGNVFNWNFIKGWGVVESYVINTTNNAFSSTSLNAVPAGTVWVNL